MKTEPTDLTSITERIRARAIEQSAAWQAYLAKAPRETTCPRHGHICRLDVDQSNLYGELRYDCEACLELERRAKDDQLRDGIGMPHDVWHATLQNFDTERQPNHESSCRPIAMQTAIRSIITGAIRNLILAGPPGIGKGHLAAAALNHRIADGWLAGVGQARWISAHRLFQAIHESYSRRGPEPLIAYYAQKPWLVLDECGMSDLPKDGQRVLYDIIDRRQKMVDRRLIILTNVTAPALKTWLSAPVVDRLRSGGLKFLWGSWPSARGTDMDKAGQAADI